MSDTSQGVGWWIASDGKWYPPELHPSALAAPPPSPGGPPPATFDFAGAWSPEDPSVVPPLTGGPPPHSFRLALYVNRVLAYIVDVVVTVVAIWALVALGVAIGRGSGELLAILLALAFGLWYHVWTIGTSGQTWGMRFLHLGLADKATGRHPVGLPRAFLRALTALVIAIVPFGALVDLLWPLWDPYNQTLHDLVASTVVLNRP
jgi:uncharacterized RDD family membrane protein YckC